MKTDSEIIDAGFQALFSRLSRVDAERFIILIKRDPFDYTKWQTQLWEDETVASLSAKSLGAESMNRMGIGRSWVMPTISTFYGIIIRMFFDEHAPPHFHAQYGELKFPNF